MFWEVDPDTLDLHTHRDYVLERVMTRGGWSAMRWLRRSYPTEALRDFLVRRGDRLRPRDLAYWALMTDLEVLAPTGGGRPRWAGK